jgi:hypothetical protein
MERQSYIDSVDPEIAERLVGRREAIRRGASVSGTVAAGLAMGSVPVALVALARDVFAQAPTDVRAVIEFAYTLENLEFYFYDSALNASAFAGARTQIEDDDQNGARILRALQTLRAHEEAHVAFLREAMGFLGGTPATYTAASFDFTGGNGAGSGPFAAAATQAAVLMAAAQAFEDTGVRAYKGQVASLTSNKGVLTAALQIHSVEARHAAQIRRLRQQMAPSLGVKSWIRNEESGISGLDAAGTAAVAAIYAGEGATVQGSVDVGPLAASFGGSAAAGEAFDEPLSFEQVAAIVDPFIVGGI